MKAILLAILLTLGLARSAEALTVPYTPQQFGGVCDGGSHPLSGVYGSLAAAQAVYPFVTSLSQQIDYAALKAMSNAALGPDGSEHGTASPQLNIPMFIPNGTCNLGSDIWHIANASGIKIFGAAATATTIEGSGTAVLQFDGLWYSDLADFGVAQLSSGATTALDIDGNTGHAGATNGVQGDTFINLLVNGGGATDAVSVCRVGASYGQCSEMTWINFHGLNASFAVYNQNGFNAIDNVLVGGDMQNYQANGIYLDAGSVKVLGTSFESTTGYTQIVNGGCDITANAAGAEDSIVVKGSRSESLCFYQGAFSQWADISGISQNPAAYQTWTASTSYSANTVTKQNDPSGIPRMYRVTTAGTSSGGAAPTWPASGTVADGSVVWTMTPYTAVSIVNGQINMATSAVDTAAQVVEGSTPAATSCGTSPVVAGTRYSGSVVEGSGATGCTLALNYWMPRQNVPIACTVSSPTGTSLTSYSTSTGNLAIVNPSAGTFNWSCTQ